MEKVPSWADLAKQTNMEQYHDFFYSHFSNLTHGNLAGSVDMENKTVTFSPDFAAMEFPVKVTRGLVANISLLFEEWWTKGTLAPAPVE